MAHLKGDMFEQLAAALPQAYLAGSLVHPSAPPPTCRMSLDSSSSPISGNLVLTTATSAAYTGVKEGDAAWDFINERQNRPRPRTRFYKVGKHRSSTARWSSEELGKRAQQRQQRQQRNKHMRRDAVLVA